jgi:uncharacterized protein involved in outer membrane biogenesis
MTFKKIILLSFCALIVLSTITGTVILFNKLHHVDTYKQEIVLAAEKALGRRLTYKSGDFSIKYGPTFTFTGVTILEKDEKTVFISTDQLLFRVAFWPLLKKKVVLREIRLEHPCIRLHRDSNGIFNFSDIVAAKGQEIPLRVRRIRLGKGIVTLTDQFVSEKGVTTSLENMDFQINRARRGTTYAFKISADIVGKGKKSSLSIAGNAKLAPKDKPLRDTCLDLRITANNINTGNYWDYYGRYVPFQKISGFVDIDSTFKGKLTDFASNGSVKVRGLYFNYPDVFHSLLTPKQVLIKYDMELTPKDISVKHLALSVDALAVKGSCFLRDIHSGDLFLSAEATTGPFRLEEFGKYIPYGIIPVSTSEFIENRIKGGTYRLQEGKLEGRISQIAHMERGTNYNVLSIRGTVDRGLVSFGKDTPSFNTIRGNLALSGKDFILSGMEGSFGGSPFKLEGRITDYPLHSPSGYPFTMTMTPGPAEVMWLLGDEHAAKFTFAGQSLLRLTGNGQSSNYGLSGNWDLTNTAYEYADIIQKPKGQTNNLSFNGRINDEEAKLSGLKYVLNSFSMNAAGSYRFYTDRELVFAVDTNQFPIQDVAPMIPRLKKYMPAGNVKTVLHGKWSIKDSDGIVLNGNALLSGFSVKATEGMKTLEEITGNIRFTENSLQTSMLSVRLGNSTLYASGTLANRKNPSLDISFSSPLLDFSDIGLHSKMEMVAPRNVRGKLGYKDGNIQIRSLSGRLNKSLINMSGVVEDIHNPKINISVTSPYLDLDDLMPLRGLKMEQKTDKSPSNISGQVTVYADSGRIRQFQFEKLRTSLQFHDKILNLQPTHLSLLGGTMAAEGKADFSITGKPRFQVNFNLKNLSASELTQLLKARREVTGNFSMQGDITARGKNLDEIKKTISGNARIESTEGSLRKFAVLSKIFSILNISQLLKFQLPDMVSGGMPYNRISGTFDLQNGVAETNDLFIDSDAMNISVIGRFDLAKEGLDLTVGVKPLQTVDKIVSHIPIVGWVLTGDNKSLVTACFEAKGNWDSPQVRAIPVKAMAKGVFNIFKRVFQLPAKLITDTGEVIIGR